MDSFPKKSILRAMKTRFYLPLAVFLLFNPQFSRGESIQPSPEECKALHQKWLKKYTANTPMGAMNKNYAWPVSAAEVDEVLTGKFKPGNRTNFLKFPMPLFSGTTPMGSYPLLGRPLYKHVKRNEILTANLAKLLSEKKEGELLIVWAGFVHAMEFSLEYPGLNYIYAAFPIHKSSEYFTEDHYKFLEALGKKEGKTIGLEKSFIIHALPLDILAGFVAKKPAHTFTTEKLLDLRQPTNTDAVIIADWHYLRETSLADDLPPGSCLSALGYKSIRVVLEQFPFGKEITDELFDQKWDPKIIFNKNPAAKKRFPKAAAIVEKGGVDPAPNYTALRRRLKEFKKHVPVTFVGLE
jgi:hypothetical protein